MPGKVEEGSRSSHPFPFSASSLFSFAEMRPWEKGVPGPQFSGNVEVWRHRISGWRTEISPPPILSTPPSQKCVGRGLPPSDAQSAGVVRGQPVPNSARGQRFRRDEPCPLLTLRTARPRQPLTRTLSPRPSPRPSPHPYLVPPPASGHSCVCSCFPTERQLREDGPFPVPLRAVSPSLTQLLRVVDTLPCE